MASKIEDMVVQLQEYIDGCVSPKLTDTFKADSIVVNRDEIDSYIEDLRANIPEEIRQYQRIINNKEQILASARKEADTMLKQVELQSDELVSKHQIMQQAYARANEVVLVASKEAESILDKANTEANEIKSQAIAYTDNKLREIQDIITAAMEETKSKADGYMTRLQGYLDVIVSNRGELAPTLNYDNTPSHKANRASEIAVESVNTNRSNKSANKDNDVKLPDIPAEDDKSVDGDSSSVDVPDVFFNKE